MSMQQYAAEVFANPDALGPPESELNRRAESLQDGELAAMFRGEEWSPWVMPVPTIEWLIDTLSKKRPQIVLEFGSGVSTLWLCVVLRRIHGPTGFRLLSLEQDLAEVAATQARLRKLDGPVPCRVVHAPLVPDVVGGRQTRMYDIRATQKGLEWLGKAEFVLIDGPYSEGPCRYGGLSKVRQYLKPGAWFALDDALREKELFVGRLWREEGIVIDGVYTVGQGIMTGLVPSVAAAAS